MCFLTFISRNENIYENAMKAFNTFVKIDKAINAVHAFYSRSHKRTADLDNFCLREHLKKFRLKSIFDVR